MKDILNGDIYEFSGIYHLVLEKATDTSRDMFWCSLNSDADMDKLLQVEDYGIVTPREEWRYVGKLEDRNYQIALENFRIRMKERYGSGERTSSKHH